MAHPSVLGASNVPSARSGFHVETKKGAGSLLPGPPTARFDRLRHLQGVQLRTICSPENTPCGLLTLFAWKDYDQPGWNAADKIRAENHRSTQGRGPFVRRSTQNGPSVRC